jgi:hypothetical protein
MTEGTSATPSLEGSRVLARYMREHGFIFEYLEVNGDHGGMTNKRAGLSSKSARRGRDEAACDGPAEGRTPRTRKRMLGLQLDRSCMPDRP